MRLVNLVVGNYAATNAPVSFLALHATLGYVTRIFKGCLLIHTCVLLFQVTERLYLTRQCFCQYVEKQFYLKCMLFIAEIALYSVICLHTNSVMGKLLSEMTYSQSYCIYHHKLTIVWRSNSVMICIQSQKDA